MNELPNKLWLLCLETLKRDIEETEYRQWLLPLVANTEGDTLILGAINIFFIKHIEKNYLEKIKKLVYAYSQGEVNKVVLQMMQELSKPSIVPKSKNHALPVAQSNALNELYTFEAFVRGKSNALAYNACYDMAKKGKEGGYHSLFIYGVSGLGKTHLMHSVAHRYQKNGHRFCYFSSDGFMQKVATAFRSSQINEFQKDVLQADLLMIDDVHLISSNKKPQIAGVLLALYSEFLEKNKQVILASDRAPTQMQGFDPRFLSRFSEGLTVAIDPPEMDTRIQILEKKASSLDLFLPKECAIFIAQNIAPDVRRLEGALHQVRANAQMLGSPIDITLVRQALKSHIVIRTHSITPDTIKDMVAKYYNLSPKELVGKKRVRHIARARQMAMALVRNFTDTSLIDIGQAFGGRDHSTVIHACDKVVSLCQEDEQFNKDYRALSATLEMI